MVRKNKDGHGLTKTGEKNAGSKAAGEGLCPSVYVANGALSLLNLCIYLLYRQLKTQAESFEKNGGFTERLYGRRTRARP